MINRLTGIIILLISTVAFSKADKDIVISDSLLANIAFYNFSTSPTYLVINNFNKNDSTYYPISVLSYNLYYHIADYLDVEIGKMDGEKIKEIIAYFKSVPGLKFNLDIERTYSDSLLNIIRDDFSELSRDSLISQICSGEIYSYMKSKGVDFGQHWFFQDAVAHVYFEKRILLDMGCLGGELIVSSMNRKESRKCEKLKKALQKRR